MTVAASGHRAAPHDHLVTFYDHDPQLVREVVRFAAEGLRAGAVVFVIATPDHRAGVDAALRRDGLDVDGFTRSGAFVGLDAATTLAGFLVDGEPDPALFREVVGARIVDALRSDRPVRAFGEMVALLWNEGDVVGAIALEDVWNDFRDEHTFELLCAYPAASLSDKDLTDVARVCRCHGQVEAPPSYAFHRGAGDVSTEQKRSQVFLPVPEAVKAARQFVARSLDGWSRADLAGDACVIVSELATNALLHARSAFRIALHRTGEKVTLFVYDSSRTMPVRRHPAPTEVGGRGIALVDGLSEAWGVDPLSGGKVVWVDLRRRAPAG